MSTEGKAPLRSVLFPPFHRKKIVKIALFALPLGIVMLLNSFSMNIPRYFIQNYCGESQLGIFAALAYIMVAGTTVTNALGNSAIPRLSKFYSNRLISKFKALLTKLVTIALLLGGSGVLVAYFGGDIILSAIYSHDYAAYQPEFILIMLVAALLYVSSFLGYSLTSIRSFRLQMLLSLLALVLSFSFCSLLVPELGMRGAIFSQGIVTTIKAVLTLCLIIFLLKRVKSSPAS
jgi:O-antigen/teichoic acid export membrane protein